MAPTPRVADIEEPIRKSVYDPGEMVWCEWSRIYYKARILERGIENDGQYYNIHYWKFSKTWDMAVPERRIIPVMAENDKWVANRNKIIRKEIKETKKAREQLLALIAEGRPPKEMPPYLNIEKIIIEDNRVVRSNDEGGEVNNSNDIAIASTSGVNNITNNHSEPSDFDGGEVNNSNDIAIASTSGVNNITNNHSEPSDFDGGEVNNSNDIAIASTSGVNNITNNHSEPSDFDGNEHVNGVLSNTVVSTMESFNNHDNTEKMNMKYENIVDPGVNITAADDSSKSDELDQEEVSFDNISEFKHHNNSVPLQCELGLKLIQNEQYDNIENDINSTSNVKVNHHSEIEDACYSKNGSTHILKRKSNDQDSIEREQKTKREKKELIINDSLLGLTDGGCQFSKSEKLCTEEPLIHKENNISFDDLHDQIQTENIGKKIDSEGVLLVDREKNGLSNEKNQVLNLAKAVPTLITDSNYENKISDMDDGTFNHSSTESGDLNTEEASTSSVSVTDENHENEIINLASESTDDGDLNIEETSTLSILINDNENENSLNIHCEAFEVDKMSFNHCASNETWSCGSSSTSLPVCDIKVESDDENNRHNLDDVDHYVDNVKVSKKKDKLDEYDINLFKDCDDQKPYSRAAKRKASEAISLMSKPLVKEKKSDGKRTKHKKKEQDGSSKMHFLSFRDLKFNNYFLQIYVQDFHLIADDRYIPVVPSEITVFDILSAYFNDCPVDLRVFNQLMYVFDYVFESLILYPIERPRHTEIVQKNPGIQMAHVYGLPHLTRFIYYFPAILCTVTYASRFTAGAIKFMRGLTHYLAESEIELTMDLYDNTLPEYVRSSYLPYSR